MAKHQHVLRWLIWKPPQVQRDGSQSRFAANTRIVRGLMTSWTASCRLSADTDMTKK